VWNSGGDINGQTVQVVDDGTGDMTVSGKIDSTSVVVLTSLNGSIIITGKIDGNSNVTLRAPKGGVTIGTAGGDDDKKIDGDSNVDIEVGGSIKLGSFIHSATATFRAHGTISMGEVDYGATVRFIADGDITLTGQINGNETGHGPSRVELVSNGGSITVAGRIDGKSNVYLTAGNHIAIGGNPSFSDDERKVDGDSFVTAIAGGSISLGSWLRSGHTVVDLVAGGGISIAKDISGGPRVRLLSAAGPPLITVGGVISDSGTQVISWPPGALATTATNGATISQPTAPWVPDPAATVPTTASRSGFWWQNWGQTRGYVAPFRVVPRSADDISAAVAGNGNADRPDLTPVKAIGGGWSFSDAVLPFTTQAEVDQASTMQRGRWQQQDLRNLLEGLTDATAVQPMDLLPQAVTRNVAFSTSFDQANLRQVTMSGAQLPASVPVRLIDTRSLAGSLQCEFEQIRTTVPPPPGGGPPEILFQVEAGITMADLQQLLDHQSSRLAIGASGGSPGATLAGALSTATHGAEFKWPLLADCVRAVHLVGPGGLQWWIEGDIPVGDFAKMAAVPRYHAIVPGRFIDASWSAIPGLTGQDVLKAVVTSMGTMGVIYSVVLAVRPQFGLHQVVHPTTWANVLATAGITEGQLHSGSTAANQAVLDVITGATGNGTGIGVADNVFANLAINPYQNGDPVHPGNRDCWIVNREVTAVPDDANTSSPGIGDYLTALTRSLSRRATDTVQSSPFAGRVFDFLDYSTSVPSVDLSDDISDVQQASRLAGFILGCGDTLGGSLAAVTMQAIMNKLNATGHHDRGQEFLADMLTGFVHALESTGQGQNAGGSPALGMNSDSTGVSYEVGAIGWPAGGLPGRGLEIALGAEDAFSFLQTVLFDDVLVNDMAGLNQPLVGYISIRVCPATQTLMGMQQFGRQPIMIEVVSYRSPQSGLLMDTIQRRAMAWPGGPAKPLLHWGLENDRLTAAYLASTPLGRTYKPGFTRLEAFRQIRTYLKHGNAPVFDNTFTARLGL
jgi:hypothetical protein